MDGFERPWHQKKKTATEPQVSPLSPVDATVQREGILIEAATCAIAPLGTNVTQRSSIAGFKTRNLRFQDKLWGNPAAGLSSRNLQFRVSCGSTAPVISEVGQAKIPVTPLSLEGAKEPPKEKYTPDNPYETTVVLNEKLVDPPRETHHIVLEHDENFPSWEGQYLGVIPLGTEPPIKRMRYFEIASSRYGDKYDGKTLSLCVRIRPGARAAAYLCERKLGDKVSITGPYASTPPIPDDISNLILPYPLDQNGTFIMVATGVGVAPFRAHLRRLFVEDIPNLQFNGLALLFHGVANPKCLLYNKEFTQYCHNHQNNFLYNWALSEEDRNSRGEKMYIQDTIYDHGEDIIRYLDKGAIIFFCGWKAMMPGIYAAFEQVCKDSGLNWDEKLKQYKENNQWRVEVY